MMKQLSSVVCFSITATLIGMTSLGCSSSPYGPGGESGTGIDKNQPGNDSNDRDASSSSNSSDDVRASSEQENGSCPSSPKRLTGRNASGSSCTTERDCAPTCCDCTDGSNQFLAAACINGTCANSQRTCASATRTLYCPNDPAPADAGSTQSGNDASSGTGLCVAGTSSSCYGSGLEWTGSVCCVSSDYGQCVQGTSSSCYGEDLEWTGSLCCVKKKYSLCVDGTSSSCYGSDLEWTGEKCCVLDTYRQCVPGTSSSCYGANQEWTGELCCIK